PDRALLPGVVEPFTRERRHRPGTGHRQARLAPAPGAAGDPERGRRGQHVFLPLRPVTGTPARVRRRGHVPGEPLVSNPRKPRSRLPADGEARVDAGLYSDADGLDPLRDPALYASRELAQLDFNVRVLAQALDPQVPLLERLRFLCISSTNMDEFFEIRVGNLLRAQELGLPPAAEGLPYGALLARIHERARELVDAQYRCWREVLRPELTRAGVRVFG